MRLYASRRQDLPTLRSLDASLGQYLTAVCSAYTPLATPILSDKGIAAVSYLSYSRSDLGLTPGSYQLLWCFVLCHSVPSDHFLDLYRDYLSGGIEKVGQPYFLPVNDSWSSPLHCITYAR